MSPWKSGRPWEAAAACHGSPPGDPVSEGAWKVCDRAACLPRELRAQQRDTELLGYVGALGGHLIWEKLSGQGCAGPGGQGLPDSSPTPSDSSPGKTFPEVTVLGGDLALTLPGAGPRSGLYVGCKVGYSAASVPLRPVSSQGKDELQPGNPSVEGWGFYPL